MLTDQLLKVELKSHYPEYCIKISNYQQHIIIHIKLLSIDNKISVSYLNINSNSKRKRLKSSDGFAHINR